MKITLLEHKPYSIRKEGEALAFFEAIPQICPYILKLFKLFREVKVPKN